MMAQTCITIIVFLAFIGMTLYAHRINNQWCELAQEQNRDWFETAMQQNEEWSEICKKITDERDQLKAKVEKLESKAVYTPVICVTSGDGYEEGKIYPLMGSNNGVHILRENQYGDVVDREFCTGGCGKGLFNSFDDIGCPSFDLMEGET